MIKEKTCKSCKEKLTINCFTKCKNVKDGYENKCKQCRRSQRKTNHKKNCPQCGKHFLSDRKNSIFCSSKCAGVSREKKVLVNCSYCDTSIEVAQCKIGKHGSFFCNSKCRGKHLSITNKGKSNPNYNSFDYNCDGCKKIIKATPFDIRNGKRFFCSNECFKLNIGRFTSGENSHLWVEPHRLKCGSCDKEFFRKKLRKTKSGKHFCCDSCSREWQALKKKRNSKKQTRQCIICKTKVVRYPSQFKDKQNIYCSKYCAGKGASMFMSGPNSHRWDRSKTKEDRGRDRKIKGIARWRSSVYGRDNYTCQCCDDNRGGNLQAHHIYNYAEHPELRLAIINGITMCKSCHKEFHEVFGFTGNNPKQLLQFLGFIRYTGNNPLTMLKLFGF